MANFIILGKECSFPSLPFTLLEDYGPIQRTHMVIWRSYTDGGNLYLRMHLNMLEEIKAIDRLRQFDLAGGVSGALFDYEEFSTRLLQDYDNYLRILCGTKYRLLCPYRILLRKEKEDELAKMAKMDDALIEIYRQRSEHSGNRMRSLVNESLSISKEITQQASIILDNNNGNYGRPNCANPSTSC